MEFEMQASSVQSTEPYVPLPLRSHTILGVCEGLGEDFGISPVLVRVPLAALVLWSPMIAVAIYFALGAVVLTSRLLFPRPKAVAASARPPVHSSEIEESQQLQLAA
jgi:phage shock protein C